MKNRILSRIASSVPAVTEKYSTIHTLSTSIDENTLPGVPYEKSGLKVCVFWESHHD